MQKLCFTELHSRDTVRVCKLDLPCHSIAKLKNLNAQFYLYFLICSTLKSLQVQLHMLKQGYVLATQITLL